MENPGQSLVKDLTAVERTLAEQETIYNRRRLFALAMVHYLHGFAKDLERVAREAQEFHVEHSED